MSLRMRDLWMGQLGVLRHEPTGKRVRGVLAGRTVVDSGRAVLVWEPRRIVPGYAVPREDIAADLVPVPAEPAGSDEPILHPGIPFAVHSTAGQPYSVNVGDRVLARAAFAPTDDDLAGYVLVDQAAFDEWLEEDEAVRSHARDPFHRVDVRASSRHVRIERDGVLLAESSRPVLLFETNLPTRYYLPRADVLAEALPSDTHTYCPYKGEASYLSFAGATDLAWYYPDPLPEVIGIKDLVAFYNEVTDITVDGVPDGRPHDPISRTLKDEFGLS
jgi:uncharacterized protein (DUF427 family)